MIFLDELLNEIHIQHTAKKKKKIVIVYNSKRERKSVKREIRDGLFILQINIDKEERRNSISHVITSLIFITYQDNEY